ncbi:MAG: phosphotransferase [Anaerolineae bacterium]|nr:phosphotransferase [Anaerolineae bacterium]
MDILNEKLAPDLQNLLPQMEIESARQGHYYLGVEHLMMALTRIENGITANALKELGLSPRFIRHSIRAAAGPGDSRRHWPGFRPTPRYESIMERAHKSAGARRERYIGERDLLLAILEEGESMAVRVLAGLGIDLERLKARAAGWEDPPTATYPLVPVIGANLDAAHKRVLSQLFRSYTRLTIIRTFHGFSDATVLLVRPTKPDGRADADVVVKMDRGRVIQYEKLRYDSYVRSTLPPVTARITDPPVVLDDPDVGGLKYTFVGQQNVFHTQNLYDYVEANGPADLAQIIKKGVFASFGWGWWDQRQPYNFALWQEYEHVLPSALEIALEPAWDGEGTTHVLEPRGKWSREDKLKAGDLVTLKNFTIYRAYPDRREYRLVAGASPLAEDRANRVVVRNAPSSLSTQGDRLPELVGRVVRTRKDILYERAKQTFPEVDLSGATIDLTPGLALHNPLVAYNTLLRATWDGTLSTIHGDLHLGNILIDADRRAWLIDFTWTRDGHTLFDWAVLEVSILTDVVAPLVKDNIDLALKALAALNKQEPLPSFPNDALTQAFEGLAVVRDIVHRCLANANAWDEYFAGFAMCALRAITWATLTPEARRLIFIAAALAATQAIEGRAIEEPYDETLAFTEDSLLDTTSGEIK